MSSQKKSTKDQPSEIKADELIPIVAGKKMSLVPAILNDKQILTIFSRTPQQHIFTRPGKGGGQFQYVTGTYVKKVLNYSFGFNWDFEIMSEEEKYGQIVVQGKLTVRDNKGIAVSKMQYGRADIKFKKDTKIPMDYGNDKKAAATDCLKKCASEFGIASDIYGANEFRDLGAVVVEVASTQKNAENGKNGPKTGSPDVDYKEKLIQDVIKQNKGVAMTQKEVCEYLSKKLGRNISSLHGLKQCQLLRVELLTKK